MTVKANERRALPALLAGSAVVMACIIYAELRARPMIDPRAAPPAAEVSVAWLPAPRQAMPEQARFSAIVERPLFSTSRRPPAAEPVMATTPTLDVSLAGVVVSARESFALVTPDSGGEPMRVKEGEALSGWTVTRIDADRIVLRHDATEAELRLDFAEPAPPVAQPAAPEGAQAKAQGKAEHNQTGTGQAPEEASPPEAEEPDTSDD
jgi:type II secretory pathway component PulC